MDRTNIDFLTHIKISIKEKWEFLNKLKDKDDDKIADLYRFFMQMAFKHIPLEERPNNKYWKLAFDELMNTNAKHFNESYKPYALFKLCRDNSMPQEYKKLIYDKFRSYLVNMVGLADLEFTRYMMHFAPYLSYQDKYTIALELMESKNPRKYIVDFVENNNVLDGEIIEKVIGFLVIKKLCE